MKIVPLSRIAAVISDALTPVAGGSAATEAKPAPENARLTGASFAEQEPGLAKEARVTGRAVSGWAMAGSSLPE